MTSVDNTIQAPQSDAHEFVQQMLELAPDVKPGTALWDVYMREYESESTSVMSRNSIVDRLFPDAKPPKWAEPDETYNDVAPAYCNWRSIPVRVNTRKMVGHINAAIGNFSPAYLSLRIVQSLTGRDPAIKVARMGKFVGAEHLDEIDHYALTLDEAAELAHILLLLLDVVAESRTEDTDAAA